MTEQNKTKVPAELIPAGNYPVVSTDAVMDRQKGKTQEEVNTEAGEKIAALEESVGSGGSVDTRIENAVNTEKARAENVEAQLSNEIDVLQKQDIVPVDSLPSVADADPKKVYRVVGTTSYTDYMVDTMADPTAWKTLATYSFPGIDDTPTAGSENLVKSGGVYKTLYGNNPIVIATATSTSTGSYHDILFESVIPAGSVITEVESIFGYFLKNDNTFDTSISTYIALPYTTLYDYKGLKTNQSGNSVITYNNGTTEIAGLKKTIEEETLNVNVSQNLSAEQKQKALENLGIAVDAEPTKDSHNIIESGAVYDISEDINGVTKQKIISSVEVPSHSGYESYYFDTPIPTGVNIEMVYWLGNCDGYPLKEDGTYDTSIRFRGMVLPYTTQYKIVGIRSNSNGSIQVGSCSGETVYGLKDKLDIYRQSVQDSITADFERDFFAIKNDKVLVKGGDTFACLVYNVKKYHKYHVDVTSVTLVGAVDYWMLVGYNNKDFPMAGDTVSLLQTVGSETEYHIEYKAESDGLLFVANKIADRSYNVSVSCDEPTDEYIDFEKEISDLQGEMESMIPQIPTINIPDTIHSYVGETLQLFFRSIINTINIDDYYVRINGSGHSYPRYYELTPSESGSLPIAVEVRNNKGEIVASKNATIVVHTSPTSPSSAKKIAIFGDSLTQGGQYPNELKRLLTSNDVASDVKPAGLALSNISFIGAMGNNAKYYGIGGWGWNNYAQNTMDGYRFYSSNYTSVVVGTSYYLNKGTANEVRLLATEIRTTDMSFVARITSGSASNIPASGTFADTNISYTSFQTDTANPLWDSANNKVSFKYYFDQCGMTGNIDVVTFLLGWNIIFMNLDNYIEDIVTLITTLHTEYPSARMAIVGIQIPSLNGGLAYNYAGDAFFSNEQNVRNRVYKYNTFLSEIADEYEYVDYVDIASQFDSENNMPEELTNVNSRNNKKEYRGTNGVHPAIGGYYQIADAICRYLINVL